VQPAGGVGEIPGATRARWRYNIRMHRLVLAALLCAAPIGQPIAAQLPTNALQQALTAQLRRSLDSIATSTDGVVGYHVVDLTNNVVVATRLERAVFPTASTIKLALLHELFRQADAGVLNIDAAKPVPRDAVVGGSGVLQHLRAPVLSLRDLAALMMILSDNTATNLVIDAVGMDKVNARLAALDLTDVKLRRKMIDAAAARRGDENVATPMSLAMLAWKLWNGEGLTPASRDAARALLYNVPGRIRSAVPANVRVASKTGSLEGVRAEAAVVELNGRPYAIAVMTTYLGNDSAGESAVGAIAGAVHRHLARVAGGGEFGRKMP
jgi:beta-lactamase class A